MTKKITILTEDVARARARLDAKIAERDMLRSIATSISASVQTTEIGGEIHVVERVQSNHEIHDKMAEQVAEICDVEEEIQQAIHDLKTAIRAAERLIFGIDAKRYTALHKVYIEGMTATEAAEDMQMSYSRVSTLLSEGRKQIKEKIRTMETEMEVNHAG